MDDTTAIIGAGHAGVTLAASLREEGYEGKVVLLSAERDLPYHRPPLSKTFLVSEDDSSLPLKAESFYAAHSIDLKLGASISTLDLSARQLYLSDGCRLSFTRLAIATGARARSLETLPSDVNGIYSLRTLEDARRIREAVKDAERIVLIGGGFIGLELAATLSGMGRRVTLLEAESRLMARAVSPEVSEHFLGLQNSWGAEIRLGQRLDSVSSCRDRVEAVVTASGDRIECDMIIVGVGGVANVDFLRDSRLVGEGGILVDRYMRTHCENVVAAGDCTLVKHRDGGRNIRIESVQNASDQARTAAKALVGKFEAYSAVPWFWSDQRDVKLQMVGLTEEVDRRVVRGDPDSGNFSVFQYRSGKLVAVDSVNRPLDHLLGRKLIAAAVSPTAAQAMDASFDLRTILQ